VSRGNREQAYEQTQTGRGLVDSIAEGMRMVKIQPPPVAVFSVGMIGLGILALLYGDFALVWRPVPIWFPFRTGLAYASGIVMLCGGLGLFFENDV
jgi:hypothetical protein